MQNTWGGDAGRGYCTTGGVQGELASCYAGAELGRGGGVVAGAGAGWRGESWKGSGALLLLRW